MRLVLCDDHGVFLGALVTALTHLGREVRAVSVRADQVADLVVEHQPEVCLLDVMFKGTARLDAAAQVRHRAPHVKILLLTGAATPEVWDAFERQKVDGVVNKLCGMDVLHRSITRVARGERVVEGWPQHQHSGPDDYAPAEDLSGRERQVLELLVEGASTQKIADQLGVSGNTVRTHVQNLLHKLGVHDRTKAVSTALAMNLLEPRAAGR